MNALTTSSNARTLCSILTLLASAGLATAQGVHAGGFLHTPIGGATIQSSSDRKLTVSNIGSSGQDGVEIKWNTVHAAGVDIDMNALSAGPQSPTFLQVLSTSIGGTPVFHYIAHGNFADGTMDESCDFSALGPPGSIQVEVTCTSSTGAVTVLPPFDGPVVTWTTHVAYGPGEQATWNVSAGKVSIQSFNFMKRSITPRKASQTIFATSTGGVIDIPDIVSVACRPICIVAPCPGDFTNVGSFYVTGTGMGAGKATFKEFTMTKRVLCPPCGPGAPPDHELQIHGTGDALLSEDPTGDLDGDGAPDDVLLCDNLGSSGQDGVEIKWPKGTHGARYKWGNGHVTLMKITDDEGSEMRMTSVKDDLTCTTTFTPDFSSFSSGGVIVECRDQFDNILSTQTLPPGSGATCTPACGIVQTEVRKGGGGGGAGGSVGVPYLKLEMQSVVIATFSDLSTGAVITVPGTKSIVTRPMTATATFADLSRFSLMSGDGSIIRIGGVELLAPDSPPCPANLDDGSGTGTLDGGVDINDLLYFLLHFEEGC